MAGRCCRKSASSRDKQIRYVVASHYHADHIYGLQAFRDHTDALIVAQERSGEYKDNDAIADEKASQRLDQRRGALYPWVDGQTRVVAPDINFRERMTIALGDRRLTLLYAGPAHSSSDMMMMVEPDGVLFAGDIVQNGRIPHMNSDDVSTTQWLAALGEVEKLEPKCDHSRPRPHPDRGAAGDRLYPGLYSISTQRHGRGGAELDRFRCRLPRGGLVEIPGFSGLREQQPRQCLPDFPGTGAIAVQSC